jgi:hypothetical protein
MCIALDLIWQSVSQQNRGERQITTQSGGSVVTQAAIQIGAMLSALSDGRRHVHRPGFIY